MSCYRPLEAYRSVPGGEVWIGPDPTRSGRALQLPCGRCVGCRLDRARAWSVRIVHESKLYEWNWFVTLTYRDEDLPKSRSLEYPHFQGMLKRLRARVDGDREGPGGRKPLRFFVAGEYGPRTLRPHFHAVLFNLRLPDARVMHNGSYSSKLLEEVWNRGSVDVQNLTQERASYVSGYALKKLRGRGRYYEDVVDGSTGEIFPRRKEFIEMSRRPGIGRWFYDRYGSDLFPLDFAIVDGKRNKVPRYYWEMFRRSADGGLVEQLEEARFERASLRRDESTPERLALREEYSEAMLGRSERMDL